MKLPRTHRASLRGPVEEGTRVVRAWRDDYVEVPCAMLRAAGFQRGQSIVLIPEISRTVRLCPTVGDAPATIQSERMTLRIRKSLLEEFGLSTRRNVTFTYADQTIWLS